MWDRELRRLYSHLDSVSAPTDTHLNPLFLQSSNHDAARERNQQLEADRVARENLKMFSRLLAVHTRKPTPDYTTQPKPSHPIVRNRTRSYLEQQRVMEDNGRLVDRLLNTRSFVNAHGSWDKDVLQHEELRIRLSHHPHNCFVPNLHERRKEAHRALQGGRRSIRQLAKEKLKQQQQERETSPNMMQKIEEVLRDEERMRIAGSTSNSRRSTMLPLPPTSNVGSSTARSWSAESNVHSHRGARSTSPPVRLPRGTHLVGPAIADEAQYAEIQGRLQQALRRRMYASASASASSISTYGQDDLRWGRSHGRVYARTGASPSNILSIPMPPALNMEEKQQLAQVTTSPDEVFYLRPHHHMHQPRSNDNLNDDNDEEQDDEEVAVEEAWARANRSEAAEQAPAFASTSTSSPTAFSAQEIPYPFHFPHLTQQQQNQQKQQLAIGGDASFSDVTAIQTARSWQPMQQSSHAPMSVPSSARFSSSAAESIARPLRSRPSHQFLRYFNAQSERLMNMSMDELIAPTPISSSTATLTARHPSPSVTAAKSGSLSARTASSTPLHAKPPSMSAASSNHASTTSRTGRNQKRVTNDDHRAARQLPPLPRSTLPINSTSTFTSAAASTNASAPAAQSSGRVDMLLDEVGVQ